MMTSSLSTSSIFQQTSFRRSSVRSLTSSRILSVSSSCSTPWPKAIAPDKFVHAEFMFRDSKKWADNGTGRGWARWVGSQQKPYGEDAGFSQECISCHTPVKGSNWVFTTPALFPTVFK
ncbi:cytochrome P460 [Thiogranum longum]|uniref:Cytochrome P460 n=1 Tax=Thiogranum longum TaxID=1537524 RepID=A0A4R1HFK9_9GAMM|nr:cytochrome P460 [Thiogranum longum]